MTGTAAAERLALIVDPRALNALSVTVDELADPDIRSAAVRLDHPELDRAISRGENVIEIAGEPINIRLHLAMHEVVAAQLADDDPPEVYLTARRLLACGYDRHEVLHMLAGAIAEQIDAAVTGAADYQRERHVAALNALPESWERERARRWMGSP